MTLEESRSSVRLGQDLRRILQTPSNGGFVDISDARQKPNEKKKARPPSNADLASLCQSLSLVWNLGRFKTTRTDLFGAEALGRVPCSNRSRRYFIVLA